MKGSFIVALKAEFYLAQTSQSDTDRLLNHIQRTYSGAVGYLIRTYFANSDIKEPENVDYIFIK